MFLQISEAVFLRLQNQSSSRTGQELNDGEALVQQALRQADAGDIECGDVMQPFEYYCRLVNGDVNLLCSILFGCCSMAVCVSCWLGIWALLEGWNRTPTSMIVVHDFIIVRVYCCNFLSETFSCVYMSLASFYALSSGFRVVLAS